MDKENREDKKKEEGGKKEEGEKKYYTEEQVRAAVEYISSKYSALKSSYDAMSARLESLEAQSDKPKGDAPKSEVPDLEAMNRTEFAQFLLGEFGKLVKPVGDRVEYHERADEERSTAEEIRALEKEHPEFWEFKDGIKAQLKKNPDLTTREAFVLAKHAAPDKVKAIEEEKSKRMEKEARETAVKEEEENKERFGGLFPTSGRFTKTDKMNSKDAAQAAWEEVGMDEHLAAISAE